MKEVENQSKNIILVGLMGCGKSTIGRLISKMLAYPFIDTDHQIEKSEGMSISTIFKQKGEPYFRNCEISLVNSLIDLNVHKNIISTGGGLPTTKEAREALPQLGYVVWLHASIETLYDRTSKTNTRPLLDTQDPMETLRDLYEQRKSFYSECAHLTINTENLDIDDVATGILESARFHFSESGNISH
ncbi:shikimate kinase [Akkermansiaceae bacterium]|nr:shikimate kinase [Akkermansiaceae bacterium]